MKRGEDLVSSSTSFPLSLLHCSFSLLEDIFREIGNEEEFLYKIFDILREKVSIFASEYPNTDSFILNPRRKNKMHHWESENEKKERKRKPFVWKVNRIFIQKKDKQSFALFIISRQAKVQRTPLIVATSGTALSGHNNQWPIYSAV